MNIYMLNFLNIFYLKYLVCNMLKYACMILMLNMFYYYNFFIILKNSMLLNFESLLDFTGVHYPDMLNEVELNYFIMSYQLNYRFFLKLFMKSEDLVMSLNKIFKSSIWLESEVWDMFGMKFMYHMDLSSILTDYGFLGHPLLKYFPLSGFYELSFDEIFNKIIKELMELAQAYRSYTYVNPWLKWHF